MELPVRKLLIVSFLIASASLVLEILNNFLGFVDGNVIPPAIFDPIFMFAFVSLYLIWSLGARRGVLMIVIPLVLVSVGELFLLEFGDQLDWRYTYNMESLYVLEFPVSVSLGWSVFVGIGYGVVTSILKFSGMGKPGVKDGLLILLMVVLFDAFVVTSIDLTLDPIEVLNGKWSWTDGGPYYNVLIKNFIGWFIAVSVCTGIFRLLEYMRPSKSAYDGKIYMMPVAIYALVSLYYISEAVARGIDDLALIGIFTTAPVVLIATMFFLKRNDK